jgi:hypothetical protein
MKNLFSTWKETFALLNKRPKIIIPFLVTGILNIIAIYLLYYAPQRPVSFVLGPPIIRFFGEKFLHYPTNFLILPKLVNYAELAIGALFGMLMTAVAVHMIWDVKNGERALFFVNLIRSLKRYISLLVIWGISFGILTGVSKILSKTPALKTIPKGQFITLYFFIAVLINMLLIYAVPLLIIKKRNLFGALSHSIVVLAKSFFTTLILVAVPSLFYLPVIMAKSKTVTLIDKFFPEIILTVLITGVIVSIISELIITTSITVLFLNKEKE